MYQTLSPIRDIVHNYVSFSIFEKEVIDSPYFQRLHFVLQNSAAYTAYPCNKNSRFVHSLGVAHLCGRILEHGLANSSPDVLREFLKEAGNFIERAVAVVDEDTHAHAQIKDVFWEQIGNSARFQYDPNRINLDDLPYEPELIVNTLWIALKICGLSHDIGHLPMSHSFEQAIEDTADACHMISSAPEIEERISTDKASKIEQAFADLKGRPADEAIGRFSRILRIPTEQIRDGLLKLEIHERRSFRILDEISVSGAGLYREADKSYRKLIFLLARSILLYSTEKLGHGSGFFAALKDIISGELDADRLDYTIRDARESGLEIGAFDLERIVVNFSLVKDEHADRFRFLPGAKSISAIESFFHQRYLLYSALVFHRTAVRSKAVLREIISRLIVFSYCNENSRISRSILNVVEKVSSTGIISIDIDNDGSYRIVNLLPDDLNTLKQFDDARLRTFFFEILGIFDRESEFLSPATGSDLQIIKLLIDTFLFRRSENMISFGKGVISAEAIRRELDISDVNPFIIGADQGVKDIISTFRKKVHSEFEGRICMLFSFVKPRVYAPGGPNNLFVSLGADSEFCSIEEVSPYLSMQYLLKDKEIDFVISFVGDNIRNKDEYYCKVREIYCDLIKEISILKRDKLQ